jgi:hypothetical protein
MLAGFGGPRFWKSRVVKLEFAGIVGKPEGRAAACRGVGVADENPATRVRRANAILSILKLKVECFDGKLGILLSFYRQNS